MKAYFIINSSHLISSHNFNKLQPIICAKLTFCYIIHSILCMHFIAFDLVAVVVDARVKYDASVSTGPTNHKMNT